MIVDNSVTAQWPAFGQFLNAMIPRMAATPRIVRGVMVHGGVTERVARSALSLGTYPYVAVTALGDRDLGRYYRTRAPNSVLIAADLAQRYETHREERGDLRLQRLVMAVLAHEIVHWADARDGRYRGETPANAFDRDVFNGSVSRYW